MWMTALLLVIVLASSGWRLLCLYRTKALVDVPVLTLLRFTFAVRLQATILWLSGVAPGLPKIPDVDLLPGSVLRVLGNNPSRLTLSGTNVYVVGTGPSRLLIDASDGNYTFVKRLMHVCERHGVREISDLLVTHGHLDHAGGMLQLRQRFPKMKVWKYLPVEGKQGDGDGDRRLRLKNDESRRLEIRPLVDKQQFKVPGDGVLTTMYTPGHCNDHVCFMLDGVKDLEAPVLFSGDCVLGVGSCMFDSLGDLMTSLAKLSGCGAATIYPGHGPVVNDAPTKICEYLAHRQQREDEVLDVLKRHGGRLRGMSLPEILDSIYKSLPYVLRLSARKAIDKHLQKLLAENRIQQIRPAGWFQSATYGLC
uniref:Metallo-beta-lactamase domain-containing protein n=1 Tax=Hyaloperonospora arabidopsidis (strain Emoy2) TaxID=559515 RepID=M4BIL0_HYAAE